ncbi:SpoIIE family protein phosphatase [Streptomyces sp. NPDC059740]|uniref:SpoIIE family protein phosphatase n=1 Tax=Streptomyces sp. NPDC059740 TaxID=3346926 RepID=UPI00364AE9C3
MPAEADRALVPPGAERAVALNDAERLAALHEAGLSASPDPGMDRFTRLVSRILGTPVALVSMVERDHQVFPGMVGLAEPWASTRTTPLSHSLCMHVTASGRPLVLPDVREDARTRLSEAIHDLGVVAYAGVPLTDPRGHTLGSLCAIDTKPRQWTEQELSDLCDLAAACSAELHLRIATLHSGRSELLAAEARERAEHSQATAETALRRSELLLRAAAELGDAAGLQDVRRALRDVVSGGLNPSYVGLALTEDTRLVRVGDPDQAFPLETDHPTYTLESGWPTAEAVRTRRMVVVPDRRTLVDGYGAEAVAGFDSLGLEAAVGVPLLGTRGTLGCLVLGWDSPHPVDVQERAVLSSVAGYTAQAVERAQYVEDRISVSRRLQEAMLTELPEVEGLELAAVYRPAAREEMVGGDWYDAYRVHGPQSAPAAEPTDADTASDTQLAVTVGDITGHDLHAATVMGQLRSMLRQADVDHGGLSPARALDALESACATLPLSASGSLVHAHLATVADGWRLTYTNAGHPPPLLSLPDGRVERLLPHDRLLHPDLPPTSRTARQRLLPFGSTLLLYTDGLVERPGGDIDESIDRAATLLGRARALPLTELVTHLADELAGHEAGDDVVLLALRVPEPPAAHRGRARAGAPDDTPDHGRG